MTTDPNAGHLSRTRLLCKSSLNSISNEAKHQFFISILITKLFTETVCNTLQVSLYINKIDLNKLNQTHN